MKKFIALFFVAALLFACILPVSAKENDATLVVKGDYDKDSKILTVHASINDIKPEYGIILIEYHITYDSKFLALMDVSTNMPDIWKPHVESMLAEDLSHRSSDGKYFWALCMAKVRSGVKEDEQLTIDLKFKVKKEGNTSVRFDKSTVATEIPFKYNGKTMYEPTEISANDATLEFDSKDSDNNIDVNDNDISKEPVTSNPPSIPSESPVESEEPVISEAPTVSEDTDVSLESEAPVVSEEPTVSEAPVVSEEPTVSEAPVVSEEPTVSEAPVVSEEPTVSEEPVVSEAPIVSEEPTVSEEPVVSEEPTVSEEPIVSQDTEESLNTSVPENTSNTEEASDYEEPIDVSDSIVSNDGPIVMPEIQTPSENSIEDISEEASKDENENQVNFNEVDHSDMIQTIVWSVVGVLAAIIVAVVAIIFVQKSKKGKSND